MAFAINSHEPAINLSTYANGDQFRLAPKVDPSAFLPQPTHLAYTEVGNGALFNITASTPKGASPEQSDIQLI